MIEFLKGGVIPARKYSPSEEVLKQNKIKARTLRGKGLSNREIGVRMKISYNTIASWLVPEARY